MKKIILASVVASVIGMSGIANAAVDSKVSDIISSSSLNNVQKKALTQYAESLDSILNVNVQNRDSVIAVNKEFMNAQQCLAQIYSIDQKPDMMRVSRKVYEATFNSDDLLSKYHEFLGQAQQEGDLALPSAGNACKK